MKDFISYELAKKLEAKGFNNDSNYGYNDKGDICVPVYNFDEDQLMTTTPCPEIHEVLKWLREEKNIDIEIQVECGMLGRKMYAAYVSTYEEFRLEDSPDVVRYRQKKRNTYKKQPQEIIPAHDYYETYEEAAIEGIEYVVNNLI